MEIIFFFKSNIKYRRRKARDVRRKKERTEGRKTEMKIMGGREEGRKKERTKERNEDYRMNEEKEVNKEIVIVLTFSIWVR